MTGNAKHRNAKAGSIALRLTGLSAPLHSTPLRTCKPRTATALKEQNATGRDETQVKDADSTMMGRTRSDQARVEDHDAGPSMTTQ